MVGQALDLVLDLDGQLARRRQHQRSRARRRLGAVSVRNRCRIGTRNAAVLPVPVSAQAMTSLPASASGMTPLCTGRVSCQPRSRMPLSSRGSSAELFEAIGVGSNGDGSYGSAAGLGGFGAATDVDGGAGRRPRRRATTMRCLRDGSSGLAQDVSLSRAEGDDAANRIVGGDADRHAIARHDLDTEAAHPAAQLRQHFVAGVALDAVQAAGMDRDHRSLHINQIVFAQ